MAGIVDFLVFDLLTADGEKMRPKAKRRSVIFEYAADEEKKKAAPASAKRKARSTSVPAAKKKSGKKSRVSAARKESPSSR
jgi:hypothetical protein